MVLFRWALLRHDNNIVILTLFLISIFLSGCYSTEKSYGVAYLQKNKTDSWEIQIPYGVKGKGSLHNFDFKKFEDSSSHFIVFSHLQKTVIADSLTLIYKKGYSPQSHLKGDITIIDSSLIIKLKIPRYNNKGEVKSWKGYNFNGTYDLITAVQ